MQEILKEVEDNLDSLIINNNFNVKNLFENIKQISIDSTISYFHEKASFNDLIDYVFLSEVTNPNTISVPFDETTVKSTLLKGLYVSPVKKPEDVIAYLPSLTNIDNKDALTIIQKYADRWYDNVPEKAHIYLSNLIKVAKDKNIISNSDATSFISKYNLSIPEETITVQTFTPINKQPEIPVVVNPSGIKDIDITTILSPTDLKLAIRNMTDNEFVYYKDDIKFMLDKDNLNISNFLDLLKLRTNISDDDKMYFIQSVLNKTDFDKIKFQELFNNFERSFSKLDIKIQREYLSSFTNTKSLPVELITTQNFNIDINKLSSYNISRLSNEVVSEIITKLKNPDDVLKLLPRIMDSDKIKYISLFKDDRQKVDFINTFSNFPSQFKFLPKNEQIQFLNSFNDKHLIPKSLEVFQTGLGMDVSNIDINSSSEYSSILHRLRVTTDPQEIFELLKSDNIKNVVDIPADIKLKIINNKDVFNTLREYSSLNMKFPTIPEINTNNIFGLFKGIKSPLADNVHDIYSKLLNSVNLEKVDKTILRSILEKHEKYNININDNTLAEMAKILHVDINNAITAIKAGTGTVADTELVTAAKAYDLNESSTFWTLGKWGVLLLVIAIVFNKSKNAITFVFYKRHMEKLLLIFKSNDYFSSKVTSKLLKFEFEFEKCADYKRFSSPIKMTIAEKDSFKTKHCFIKYIGSSFLFLMRCYKDYLKYKGIQISRLDLPEDLIRIRDERIDVNIKNSLYNMSKIVNVFLDDVYKQRLLILFKLVMSDNFDISRFEFDDFK